MTRAIDLNADLGEGDACDDALLGIVSSCNIACGAHAGDAATMRRTVQGAIASGVAIGAHPSYPDRTGRGRRPGFLRGAALLASLNNQLADLERIVADAGARIAHVKAHGALYNDAADDRGLADCIAAAAARLPGPPALVGLPGSEIEAAARAQGLRFIAEAFVDRAYLDNGRLVPRSEPAAVHTDPETIARQAVGLATKGRVPAASGGLVQVRADTLCLHGDTPGAEGAARAVRAALEKCGVAIHAVGE
jgi:UPF0271 protein